jgi:hypothetical protein
MNGKKILAKHFLNYVQIVALEKILRSVTEHQHNKFFKKLSATA